MGHKRRGRFHFIFQYIGRSICVFLATFIAADQKWFIDVRSRQYCVRLPEWNPVHTKEIAAPVKPVVLTYNHPAIIAVYPHFLDRKSTRLNSSHGYISYAVFCLKK